MGGTQGSVRVARHSDGCLPIRAYAAIGDGRTVALVGSDGTIDWLCLPHFDSPSIFASILDTRKGGFFRVAATSEAARRPRQMYLPDSNILVTRWLTPEGVGVAQPPRDVRGRA